MDELRPKQYETVETINIGNLKDDLGIADIKTIEEKELQGFLMDEPVPEVEEDEIEDIERVEKKKPAPKKKQDFMAEENDVDDYLSGKEDVDEDDDEEEEIPPVKPKKQKREEPKAKEKAPVEDDEEDVFVTLNRDLIKAGMFGEDDEDEPVTDPKSFKNKFIKEMTKGSQNILEQALSQHGPEAREAMYAILNGVPPDKYYQQRQRIDDIENIDLSSVDNQEKVLRSFYQSQKYSNERINKNIERLKNTGELEDEATDVHKMLVEQEHQRMEDEKEAAYEETQRRELNKQNYKSSIQKLLNDKIKAKSFDGIPVNPQVAGKIYQNLVADAYRLPDGRLITEFDKAILELDRPENFEKKMKLALLLENDLDLSIVKKEAIKEEHEDMFAGLARKKAKKQIPSSNQLKSFF